MKLSLISDDFASLGAKKRYNRAMSHPRRARMQHHFVLRYPTTLRERLYAILVGPLFVVAAAWLVFHLYPSTVPAQTITLHSILLGTVYTTMRILAAYALSCAVALPLSLLAERSRIFEAIFLPVFDVLQSIPNLAVLPLLIVFFARFAFPEGAAVALLFFNMLWNMVFALVGGLQVIPKDVKDAAHIFGLRGLSYVRRLIMPAIFPQFVTGSILSFAQGWNIIIVAEALHVYIPGGTSAQDLFGVGSILVWASSQGQHDAYLLAFSVIIAVIALFNFFVWQKLLHLAQRFRFD